MNIAYLVLAHNQPLQLERLMERLNQPTVHFYIHVDKKSRDLPAIRQSLSRYQNVEIISTYNVHWMGFNMVRSTLALMRLAFSSGLGFKYFVLLSGQDYPVKTNGYINDFFRTQSADFISYNQLRHLPESFRDKTRYRHFPDVPYTNPRSVKKIPLLVRLYYGLFKRFKKYFPMRSFYNNYEPYFGSQWFALTNDTVAYILRFVDEHKGYLHFMKYTEGPDEMFFQTIILNSERRNNLYDYDRYRSWLNTRKEGDVFLHEHSSLRYMDWSERGKPKPAILDAGYYEALKTSKYLFARKFDETVSAELLQLIDSYLLAL